MIEFEVVDMAAVGGQKYEGPSDETTDYSKGKALGSDDGRPHDLFPGDVFTGCILLGKNPPAKIKGTYTVIHKRENKYKPGNSKFIVRDKAGREFSVTRDNIKTEEEMQAENDKQLQKLLAEQQAETERELAEKQKKIAEELFKLGEMYSKEYNVQLEMLVNAGIKNIWMVGPAGCGKTTMAKNLAEKIGVEFYSISCGVGTSAAEFVGYKYPQREGTDFARFYAKPSIILIDEFTALDPSVAQICNAALANGYINTTTGKVLRNEQCIIIATSNTFGQGASRQYVANNQLDASTIDRFVGGMIEVNYSFKYESRFRTDVVEYVYSLRDVIKNNGLRRIASTRMIIEGEKLANSGVTDWKKVLISNWTDAEKNMVNQNEKTVDERFIKSKQKTRHDDSDFGGYIA